MTTLPPIYESPIYEVDAPVVAHEKIIGNEYEIVFHAPEIAAAARPGQFVEILFGDNYAPLLRRPFSLYRVDRRAGTCSVLYLARGSFTSGLAVRRPGDRISLLGPLGRPFTWTSTPGTRHLLVAGGIGAPPIYFLARELCRENAACREEAGPDLGTIVVLNGARTQELLVAIQEFGGLDVELIAMTDDGSHARQGIVTEALLALLDEETDAVQTQIYACGPMPMLRALSDIALARDLPCQVSIETSMPCGIGLCQGCAVSLHDPGSPTGVTYALACTEGPVFEAKTLLWK